eukprot:642139-Pyramimonas_sp.AAC.1
MSGRTLSRGTSDLTRTSAHVCFAGSSSRYLPNAFERTLHSSREMMFFCVLVLPNSPTRLSSVLRSKKHSLPVREHAV